MSKMALKDAVLELGSAVRTAHDKSSAVLMQAWHSAERHMGKEVQIEDPAMRGLFEIHVLQVEVMIGRVRRQAAAVASSASCWCQPRLLPMSHGLRSLAEGGAGAEKMSGWICDDIAEAGQHVSTALARLQNRIQEEVVTMLDGRVARHDDIREWLRERQRLNAVASGARRDWSRLRQERCGESGLPALNGEAGSPSEQAEARVGDVHRRVAELDTGVLEAFADLESAGAVVLHQAWAALVVIQSDFYISQQTAWRSVVEACKEYPIAVA